MTPVSSSCPLMSPALSPGATSTLTTSVPEGVGSTGRRGLILENGAGGAGNYPGH